MQYPKNSKNTIFSPVKFVSKAANLSSLLYASSAFVLLHASLANAGGIDLRNTEAGSISVSRPDINHTNVTASNGAIGNFNSFDIASGHFADVIQPGADSSALFRVVSGKPTEILGTLHANGKLMLVNPDGVFFGKNSRVDVAGLVASSADIKNEDFLSGRLNLSIAGKENAAIVNKGVITAADGGLVTLVAPGVRNDGVIQANMGTVALASAQTASIDLYGDNLYSFALDKETTIAANGGEPAIINSGIISVGGGKVLLTAKAAKGVVDNVINNTGIIEATSAHMEGGAVVLDAGDGNIKISGKIRTSGIGGGAIGIKGAQIEMDNAALSAESGNISVTGTDVRMKKSSIRSKTGDVAIDNSGKFSSDTADVLLGKTVTLRQNTGGSIQNAVDAVGLTSPVGAQLLLGNGSWNEAVNINQNYFTLKGNGAENTIIKLPYVSSAPVIAIDGGKVGVTISGLGIDGGGYGVSSANNSGFTLKNTSISNASITGLLLNHNTNSLITDNIFNGSKGIEDSNSTYTKVLNNRFYVSNIVPGSSDVYTGLAMKFIGDYGLTVKGNYIGTGNTVNLLANSAILLGDVTGSTISANNFDAIDNGITVSGGKSLVIDGNNFRNVYYAITSDKSLGIKITGNTLNGVTSPAGSYGYIGIGLSGGLNSVLKDNTINDFMYGILAENNNSSSLLSNTINRAVYGAYLTGNSYSLVSGNKITGGFSGIYAESNLRTDIAGNNISGSSTGIDGKKNSFYSLTNNILGSNNLGAYISGSDGVVIKGNTISGNLYGFDLDNSGSPILNNNIFSGNAYYSVFLKNSNDASLTGNNFTGGATGAKIDSSSNVNISGNSFTNTGTAIQATGSASVILKNTNITGGSIGVNIIGSGASVQFGGDNNSFSGVNTYFQLEDGALSGKTLDASAQIFDGLRAGSFTVAQRNAAEEKTIDKQDNASLGDVSYLP